jgi:hypothetical protein
VRARRAGVERILSENRRALEATKKFEARQPTGFFDVVWGSSPKRTAEVIVENLQRGDQPWKEVNDAAVGKPLPKNQMLAVSDKDRTAWSPPRGPLSMIAKWALLLVLSRAGYEI